MPKQTPYERVTERILERMAEGEIPWRKPWRTAGGQWPSNLTTGRAYSGGNVVLTACQGYESPYWLTFNQARTLGGCVRKGEKGTLITYWGQGKGTDANGDEKGYRFLKLFNVFNMEQCDGVEHERLAPTDAPLVAPVNPIEAAESLVAAWTSGPSITHGGGSAAYNPLRDAVRIPERDRFVGSAEYYSTLFHELGHSTGHAKRLNREGVANPIRFGSHAYSEEELIAEFTACFLRGECGIESAPTEENSVAYLQSWGKVLRAQPKLFLKAAAAAQRAADTVRGVTRTFEAQAAA